MLAREFGVMLVGMLWLFVSGSAQAGKAGLIYSKLPIEKQRAIEEKVAPVALSERDNPYSTPMYYLFHKGFKEGFRGGSDASFTLDRNRADWQETLMKDWAELGLTSTHFLTGPSQWNNPEAKQQIKDYFALSSKYGLKVGIRLGEGIYEDDWNLHPKNPDNRIDEYVEWVKCVATAAKGIAQYYVVGDEINTKYKERDSGKGGTIHEIAESKKKRWTPEVYMQVFSRISTAIKQIDPDVKVSMFGMYGLDLEYMKKLLELDYQKYGDGGAANVIQFPSYAKLKHFVHEVKSVQPDFKVFSNGVGYIGSRDAVASPTNHKWAVYSDKEQASRVAKQMFQLFDVGWDVAPYYIILREWIMPDGKIVPHWFGFFGFCDIVVDEHDNISMKRYSAWYSYQTIANIFYTRTRTKKAEFKISTSEPVDFLRVFERNDYECLIVLWNENGRECEVNITVPSQKYRYPVKISLCNYRKTDSLKYEETDDSEIMINNIKVTGEPVILRLVHEQ